MATAPTLPVQIHVPSPDFNIWARVLDYCSPVDLTFGDFLRAIITAHPDFLIRRIATTSAVP